MGALSAKTRLKTVWGQVNSSLAFAFAGLLLTEWGTRERISLRFTSVDRTNLVSLRSPLPTADLPAWLMAQGRGRSVRIWLCSQPQLQLWELLGQVDYSNRDG